MYKIRLHKNFLKTFEKIDNNYKDKILFIIIKLKKEWIYFDSSIKKLSGYDWFYRFRVWDYRLGIYLNWNCIDILLIKSRWDFYKIFPKNYI